MLARLTLFAAALQPCQPAAAQTAQATREVVSTLPLLEAVELIQSLNANLLSSSSATASLEKWCRDHRIADDPRVFAQIIRNVDKPVTSELRKRLNVGPDEPVRYRRVELHCGSYRLSEADNWYVPGRLTGPMNQLLEETDTPFGKVVRPLAPRRLTIDVRMLWSPLPDGWQGEARQVPLEIPEALFEHRAILYNKKGEPISEVHEVYQKPVLAVRKRLAP